MKGHKTQKGFTLIELMIVVAIIGILASVAIPQYQDYIARTDAQTSISSSIQSLKTAIQEYNATYGNLPDASRNTTATTPFEVLCLDLGYCTPADVAYAPTDYEQPEKVATVDFAVTTYDAADPTNSVGSLAVTFNHKNTNIGTDVYVYQLRIDDAGTLHFVSDDAAMTGAGFLRAKYRPRITTLAEYNAANP